MSFFTSGVHTRYIQPTTNTNRFRTEFRLNQGDDVIYFTDLRLCNLGFSSASGNQKINELNGLYSCIKNLTLMDGNITLSQVLNLDKYSGFKCYNKTNDENLSKNQELKKNNMGFVTVGENPTDGSNSRPQIGTLHSEISTTTDVSTTPQSWFSLKEYLPMLDESRYLPLSVYKDLRVVIEYSSSLDDMLPNGSSQISTVEPFLVVSELTNEEAKNQIRKQYNGVVFQELEHSRVRLDELNPTAGDPNPKQDVTFTINSFNNKTLNRLLMIKTPTQTSSTAYGKLGSVGQYKEQTQVFVNGASLLPDSGLTTHNQAQAMLYDLWGDANNIVGADWLPDTSNAVDDADDRLGQLDYRSVMVENFVNDFQIQFQRNGQYKQGVADENQKNQKYNQALNIQLFGEVNKAVAVNPDGSYQVRYL